MRPIWTGALSFGLVNIPVRLYSATEDHGLNFDMLHKKDLSPIRYARICKVDGKEIPYDDIVKGYQYEKGDYVVLTDEDFKKANIKKTKTIDIIDFSKEEDIDSVYFEKPYYLEPDKGAFKAYALLREAIKKSKKVGIAKFVLRNREHLAALRAQGDVIVLNQLRFDEEIRKPDLKLPGKEEKTTSREVEMALALIDQLTSHFKPQDYKDTYVKDVKQIINQKLKGKKPKAKGSEKDTKPTEVHDIMAMLKESLEKHKETVR